MKAISLWQPWASFIAEGHKEYETRSWSTSYRGLIAIHAAKRWTRAEKAQYDHLAFLWNAHIPMMSFGSVICICNLTAIYDAAKLAPKITIKEKSMGDFSAGRYAWRLEVVSIPEKPIPATGRQGLWNIDLPPGNWSRPLEITPEAKLTIEMVPRTSWYNNVRSMVSQSEWDVLRKSTYRKYNHRCGICGAKGRLSAHEIWHYDDETHIQRLDGLIALCDMCHHVKHIGLAQILSTEGKLDFNELIAHFCTINNCDKETFVNIWNEATDKWLARSEHEWTVDIRVIENGS